RPSSPSRPSSQLRPTLFAELRVDITRSATRGAESRGLFYRPCLPRLSDSPLKLFFHLRSIAAARIELPDETRRAGAEACRHLVEVAGGQLPHRLVEFQFLDRPQDEHLLAVERRARPLADHLRAIVVAEHQRTDGPQDRDADDGRR